MMKKYVEWTKQFYGKKELFSNDLKLRNKAWKAVGKATIISLTTIAICNIIDYISEKIVEKKVDNFRSKLVGEVPEQPALSRVADVINYENKTCSSMRIVTAILGFVVGVVGSIIAIKQLKKD